MNRAINLLWPALVTLATIGIGFVSPWWAVAIPAALAGATFANRRRVVLVSTVGSALGWLIVLLIQDLPTAGRLSSRVASVSQLSSGIFAYFVVLLIAAIASSLAAHCTSNFVMAIRELRAKSVSK